MASHLSRWTAEEIAVVVAALDDRPRKILGWKTPAEAFDEQLLAFPVLTAHLAEPGGNGDH